MNENMLVDILVFCGLMALLASVTRLFSSIVNRKKVHGIDPARFEDRLAKIEQIVETTAIEVERISEAQRFTARVLAERNPGAALPAPASTPPRNSTPH